MKKVKILNSIIDNHVKNEIEAADWCADLVQYAAYKCQIDGLIAAAYLFCPQIIQVKDYIFIEQFWNSSAEESIDCISRLEEQYNHNKKAIEMSVNTWSIGDFFVGDSSQFMNNEKVLYQFSNALAYFWQCRVKELFPDKKIVVELGKELMGELGLCITMYEAGEDMSRNEMSQ